MYTETWSDIFKENEAFSVWRTAAYKVVLFRLKWPRNYESFIFFLFSLPVDLYDMVMQTGNRYEIRLLEHACTKIS